MKKLSVILILSTAAFWGCAATQEMNTPKVNVSVTNPSSFVRNAETISLDWEKVNKSIPGLTADTVAVLDVKENRQLTTQVTKNAQLLFQTDLAPSEKKQFQVMVQPGGLHKPANPLTTYCRFIPERKDDFGWENDKAAYRMYGPALEYETITSGIDAWGKCVPYPVIDKFIWNYNNKKISYHDGHSDTEGGDFYKVGNTLGCGGMAPLVNDKVCLPRNFVDWIIIDNGPIRSTFELTYKSWEAGSYTVSEVKRISIDLGSNMNRIECVYNSDDTDELPLAAGIIMRETSDQIWKDDQTIAYWLPTDFIKSMFGCGVVFGSEHETDILKADNHLLLKVNQKVGEPVVYYAGSCWDKNEEFNSFEKWQAYLENFKARLDAPVNVKMQKMN